MKIPKTIHMFTLNWNGEEKLKKLAPSLSAAAREFNTTDHFPLWEIRDNGSKDNSEQIIKDNYEYSYGFDPVGHNRASFAQGMNYLWKEVAIMREEDLILFLNNDVVIQDPASLRMMYELQRKTKADVVGARLLFENTNRLQHAGVIFSDKYNRLPYHYRPGEESDKNAQKNRWFQAVTAACCLVTGEAFARIGGFDEGFRWAFDDVDMCLQIGATGGKVAYCGGTTIYHEESASLKKNPVNKMFIGPNVERFRKKWTGKYEIDHEKYLKNPKYKEI